MQAGPCGNAPGQVPTGRLTRHTLAISACRHLSRSKFDGFCPVRRRGPGGARRSPQNVRGTLPRLGPDVRPWRSSGAREDGKRTLRRSGRRGAPRGHGGASFSAAGQTVQTGDRAHLPYERGRPWCCDAEPPGRPPVHYQAVRGPRCSSRLWSVLPSCRLS